MGIKTHELLKMIDIPRQKLYYLEQKGYIKPQKIAIGEKSFREYSEEDVKKIECIWRHLKKGFKYRVAHEKAQEELSNPQMNLIPDKNLQGQVKNFPSRDELKKEEK